MIRVTIDYDDDVGGALCICPGERPGERDVLRGVERRHRIEYCEEPSEGCEYKVRLRESTSTASMARTTGKKSSSTASGSRSAQDFDDAPRDKSYYSYC